MQLRGQRFHVDLGIVLERFQNQQIGFVESGHGFFSCRVAPGTGVNSL